MNALSCVVLAHEDPDQVRRLVEALDPFPVLLHCDQRTPAGTFQAMTADLPSRVRLLPRMATGWASWQNVAAELAGYAAALRHTDSGHIAVLTGSDYPLSSAAGIRDYLQARDGVSIAPFRPLPRAGWGRSGGLARLRYRHWVIGKRMLRLPVPRALPAGITPAGGSQLKILSREHAARVLAVCRDRPELARFWQRSWIPDESFIASILCTPALVPDWVGHSEIANLWYVDWGRGGRKSPRWLSSQDEAAVLAAAQRSEDRKLFARKFSSALSGGLRVAVDAARERDAA